MADAYKLKFTRNAETLAEFDILEWVNDLESSDQKYLLEDSLIKVLSDDNRKVAIKVTSINRWRPDAKATDKESITFGFSILTSGF